MALENQQITVIEGGRRKLKHTADIEREYKSVSIGPSNLLMSESPIGTLAIGAPIVGSAATASTHMTTKGQMDAADAAVTSAYQLADTALSARATIIEADIVIIEGRLDTDEADILDLQGDVAATDGDVALLEGQMAAILANIPAHYRTVGDGSTATFTVPFAISADNTVLDVVAYIDGRKMEMDTTGGSGEDFTKISTSQVTFAVAPPIDKRIVIWKQGTSVAATAGGSGEVNTGGNTGVGAQVFKNKLGVVLQMRSIVAGTGISVVQNTNDITISNTAGAALFTKTMQNLSGATIPAGYPVSKKPDGSIIASDSDGPGGLQNYIGISLAIILNGAQGVVIVVGPNIAGAITGLGFAPGDEVLIAENGGYTNDPNSFTDANDSIIKVGVADCASGAASPTATDIIMFSEVIIRP